ncbi:RHS repeat-associated core domain-containing protein, partial [Pseudofrankia sp. BMG5.36]|uniref:RHS repeat-associated core domain-containing protein n=1 Tax=Pseudofrankia sp. BMG5.36 TaxID=1834512 RepID=UPI0008D8E2C0
IPAAGQRGVALPLAAVVDRGGNTVEFGYDLDGDLAQVSHSGGYRLDIETRDHLVTAVHIVAAGGEPARELVGYRYDGAGRLTHIVNSSGQALRFDYDTDSRIIRWADRNGTEYRYTYDASGRVIRTEGSDGYLDGTITYDETARITRETNSLGHVTEYHFTGRLRPLRQVDPLGRTTTFAWDASDNRTAETDPLGRTVRYRYDEAGNLTELERPDGTAVTTTWNEQRRPVTTVDADGARVEREYDAAGNLTAIVDPIGARTRFLYDGRGRLMAVTDALGRVTQIETDPAGMPIAVIDPAGAATSYERDALGRIITVTDPIGGITRFTWTPEGRLTARTLPDGAADTYRYDAEGNLVEHTDPAGLTTTTEVTHFDLPATRTSPDGARLTFDYDTELRLIAVTNPQGLVWRYDYDPAGQLVTETDYNGRTLRYGYDPAGQLTTRTNGADQTVTFTRDLLGNVLEKHGPTGVTAFAYDPAGQMVRATGPDAEVTFERDPAGRVVTETIDGRRVVSEYDSLGRRIRRTTPSGAVSHWEYDPTGRPLALHTAGQTLRFTHDAAGRETERLLLPGSPGTGNSARDTLRPTGSGSGSSGSGSSGSDGSGTAVALTQTWDTNHQLLSQTIIAGPLESFGTVSASLARPAGAAVTQLLQRRDFSYSPDGYVTEIDDLTSGLRYFDLDPMRRITTITGTDWQERYAYDTVGNITNATWPTPSPTADPLTAGPAVSGGDGRGDREDDERGEREYNGALIRRAGAVRYEHDAQGRITLRQRKRLSAKPRTWRYTWDADDRLTTVTTPDGTIWHYRYDPFGRRTAKHRLTTNGTIAERTTFTWDGTLLAEQHHTPEPDGVGDVDGGSSGRSGSVVDGGGVTGSVAASAAAGLVGGSNGPGGGAGGTNADGLDGFDSVGSSVTTWDWEPDTFRPLAQSERRPSDGTDQTWFDTRFHAIVTDLIGTPTELIAPDGTLAWHPHTTLWGVTAPPTPDTPTCPLRFPGQYHDPESGLNYNYYRHYDPGTARYESPDPLGIEPGPSPYNYGDNPVDWFDPLGLMGCETVRMRHYTNALGKEGIVSTGLLRASDQNKVFMVPARGGLMSPRDAERTLGIGRGRGRHVLEFDIPKNLVNKEYNSRMKIYEWTATGDQQVTNVTVLR